MTSTITRDEMTTTLDVLRRINAGPFSERLGHQTDRLALVALSAADEAGERITMGQLGARIDLSRAAVTALTDRLELVGCAMRVPDPSDRRQTIVVITDAGRKLIAEQLVAA